MSNIFIGFIFLFFEYDLTFGKCVIGFIPDFVGYFFIIKGLAELHDKSSFFESVFTLSKLMLLYSLLRYILDITTVSQRLPAAIPVLLGCISAAAYLFIAYRVIQGIKDMERRNSTDLKADALHRRWQIAAAITVGMYVLSFLPVLFLFSALCGLVAGIIFLVSLYGSKKAYDAAFSLPARES